MARHQRYYRFSRASVKLSRADLINKIADREDVTTDEVLALLNDVDPTRKARDFVLKLWANELIRLPEDSPRLAEALANFQQHKARLEQRDINRYANLHELEEAIEPHLGAVSKRQGGNSIRPETLPGVEVLDRRGSLTAYKVSDESSLAKLGEGTKWCTRESAPTCMARNYIRSNDWIGVVYDGNRPVAQFTPDYNQVMDQNDVPVKARSDPELLELLKSTVKGTRAAYEYAKHVLKRRWPEAEAAIAEDFEVAYLYAKYVLKRRWPEAEAAIAKDPHAAYTYAVYVLERRWPEAEATIAKDAWAAYNYASAIIQGRWPEAEATIAKDAWPAYLYAKYIIQGRWPEAEATIAEDSEVAVDYAIDVLKRPWHEREARR